MQVDVEQGGQQPQVGGDRGLEREQVQDPPLHLQIQGVNLVIALDHRLAALQVAAGKSPQRLFQQQPGLGAGLLDLALEGAQLLMKALPVSTISRPPCWCRGCPRKYRPKLLRAQGRE
jgi:hypothetical protein